MPGDGNRDTWRHYHKGAEPLSYHMADSVLSWYSSNLQLQSKDTKHLFIDYHRKYIVSTLPMLLIHSQVSPLASLLLECQLTLKAGLTLPV